MKTVLLYFGIVLLTAAETSAQPVIQWQRSLGGSSYEQFPHALKCPDGGFIMSATTNSNNGNVSGNHGSIDLWVVKLGPDGMLSWQKCLGGTGYEEAGVLLVTTDGHYLAGCHSNSNDGDVSGNHGASDIWIVKLDSTGAIIWQKCLGGSLQDHPGSIIQTSDGGFVVAGQSNSTNGDVSGNHGQLDYWIVKLDSTGNLQWQQCFGGTRDDYATSIQQTHEGGFIVGGITCSNDGDVINNSDINYGNEWILKLDSLGALQWQRCLGGSGSEFTFSVLAAPDSGYFVMGATTSNDGDVSGNHSTAWDCWIVRLDSQGLLLWQKCIGGTSSDLIRTAELTTDQAYIVSGNVCSTDGDITSNRPGSCNYWIAKIDTAANILWQTSIGGTDEDVPCSIQECSDGEYLISGSSESTNEDIQGNHGSYDIWVVKLNEKYNTISGKTYADANNNLQQDSSEFEIPGLLITELNSGAYDFCGTDGRYQIHTFDTGNFIVTPNLVSYYTPNPADQPAYFTGFNQTDSLSDFAFQPAGVYPDVCISLSMSQPVDFSLHATYLIHCSNPGTTSATPTVVFTPDANIAFDSSSLSPSSVTNDSITWIMPPLLPYQTEDIFVYVSLSPGLPIGTLINSFSRIEPVSGDFNPACNYSSFEFFTTGPLDPNAIAVSRSTVFTNELASPPYLTYTVYFQNVGNDTALNVSILNNLPDNLDLTTFEFIAASHPVSVSYSNYARLMEFSFDGILLPDSIADEPGSNGFAQYRIKPLSSLVAGDTISNQASIYFDFNQGVLTNEAITVITLNPGLTPPIPEDDQPEVYPNPTLDYIYVRKPGTGINSFIVVYNIFGEKALTAQSRDSRVDVRSLPAGLYFVEITSGGKTEHVRIVKK